MSIIYFLLIFFIAFTLFLHVFTSIYLFIENKLGQINTPDDHPKITINIFLKNFLKEYFFIMCKFILFPAKYININKNLDNMNNDTVILLVHGYGRSQIDWLWFSKELAIYKHPIYTINLSPNFGAIQLIAHSLEKRIQAIFKETNCKQIILIGHSMGGLVSSYYSEYLDTKNQVKTVITIASPFYGTKVSVAGFGVNAQQMTPGSKFLSKLVASIQNSKKSYFHIASQLDNMIFPWQSTIIKNTDKNNHVIFPHATHLGLLYSKQTVQIIDQWITGS